MNIEIIQGHEIGSGHADVHVVIDVIRAFAVAHAAFMNGVRGIVLAETVEEAVRIKTNHPDYILAGEVRGLPIEGFELDNSPTRMLNFGIGGKHLIQKTTNGVTATLRAMNAEHVLVTGFTNARTTAEYIQNTLLKHHPSMKIGLIASHPTGDDDLACAEYIAGILEHNFVSAERIIERIRGSEAAQKFFDPSQPSFPEEDIAFCTREMKSDFVMRVTRNEEYAVVGKEFVDTNTTVAI